MDKLKELVKQGWTFSACYSDDTFYIIATYGNLDIVKCARHADLEIAISKLRQECEVTDVQITSSP